MKTYRILFGASLLAVLGACGTASPTEPRAGAGDRGSRTIITAPGTQAPDTTASPKVPTVNSDAATTVPPERDNGLLGSGVG